MGTLYGFQLLFLGGFSSGRFEGLFFLGFIFLFKGLECRQVLMEVARAHDQTDEINGGDDEEDHITRDHVSGRIGRGIEEQHNLILGTRLIFSTRRAPCSKAEGSRTRSYRSWFLWEAGVLGV